MAADPSIYSPQLQAPRSALDYANDFARADQLRNANALQALSLQQQTAQVGQQVAASNALAKIASGWNSDTTLDQRIADLRNSGLAPLMTQADTLQTQADNRTKVNADAAKANADAAKTTQGVGQANYTQAMQKVLAFQSPADAIASLNAAVASGKIDMQHAVMMQRSIPMNDPAAFDAWKRNWAIGIADPAKMSELLAPHINTMNTGGAQVTQAIDPITLKPTTISSVTNTVSPDAQLQANTSTANNRANIAKDLAIAGVDASGNPLGNTGAMIDMLGNYQLDPKQALQRLSGPQRANIVAQVQAKYPGWDETTYDAKKGAAQKFTYGDQGNALRSVAVANNHLDQLGELVDALGNGNAQVINRVGNYFATQTGNPNVTNFDAIKNIVGQEVVKAIVAGGGSAGERDEAAKAFSDAASPAQLKGAISHYRAVMAAQQSGLLSQRRAAGLPDSTLPNYSTPAAAPAAPGAGVPPDIAAILAKHGGTK